MKPGAFSSISIAAAAVLALGAGAARGQAPAGVQPAALNTGPHVFKLTNGSKSGIQAVYAAPTGTLNLSDDLLGKQVAGVGKTVTLKVNDKAGTCVFDLQFLMNDGDAVDMKGVDLCKTSTVTYGG
jgi:hypothetical protein